MTIDDQIRDEKLQYDINRKAAEISALSSGKIDKYEYLTGKDILPSNQQQIIEQAKFTYSPLGKAFENQTKTIKDQGNKQVEALENLKPKELTKAIKDEPFQSKMNHNHSRATIVFNDLINKKKILRELYESVDKNKLYFEYAGSTKDVRFYEYMDSEELFKELKDNNIRFDEALKKQQELLKKINEVKMGNKTPEQKEVINNLE